MIDSKPPASDRTVLIVDDDEDILTLLEILVQRDGFRILLAASGEEALRLMREKPHALVLDLFMPGTDGFRVLETLDTLPAPPPVIVITGSPNPDDAKRASQSPCVKAILKKPIRQEDLLAKLHGALGTRPAPPKKPASED
ncbi:MAG: response regulator [Elusimicrobia bacterium]|nr:response regulator [Elusimicrobiota bacterium]